MRLIINIDNDYLNSIAVLLGLDKETISNLTEGIDELILDDNALSEAANQNDINQVKAGIAAIALALLASDETTV